MEDEVDIDAPLGPCHAADYRHPDLEVGYIQVEVINFYMIFILGRVEIRSKGFRRFSYKLKRVASFVPSFNS